MSQSCLRWVEWALCQGGRASAFVVGVAVSLGCGSGGTDEVAFGPATVVVMPGGEAAEGVPMWFQDADGEMVGEQVTAADGSATLEVGRDSMVTFMLGEDLHTVGGVQPEEVIELRSAPLREVSTIVGQVTVSAEPVQGATQYEIALGCDIVTAHSSISPSGEVKLRDRCLEEDGTFDVVVAAVDERGCGEHWVTGPESCPTRAG